MKAVIYEEYGPPEVLRIVEVPKPSPSAGEVLIKVHATTVNRTDTGFRSALYVVSRLITGILKPKKTITGTEFAGKIVEVGEGVEDYMVGDDVFGFDDARFGAHAEYKTEPATGPMAKIPTGFSYDEVAAAGEGATYALNVIEAAGVKKGQYILVNGASGAIGSASVQICKHMGATVVAVCGTKDLELIKSLGADKVIDYQTEDFTKLQDTFDVIIDAVGKSTYGACKKLLGPKGIYVSSELGPKGQNIYLAIWYAITRQRRVIFPIPKINKEKLQQIQQLLESGSYKPVIDSRHSIDEIVEVSRYVESGQKTGNVVITLD